MRTNRTRCNPMTSKLGRASAFVALNLVLATSAIGQTTTMPLSTIEAASIGGSQQSQISSFVDHWGERAASADAQAASRAQTKLLEPLINSRVSIAFRSSYSDALGSYFDSLTSAGDIGSTLRSASCRRAGDCTKHSDHHGWSRQRRCGRTHLRRWSCWSHIPDHRCQRPSTPCE